jgi:hypothetical protein
MLKYCAAVSRIKKDNDMKFFRRLKAYLALREAIRKADDAHASGGGRYYVLGTTDGKLIVTDKKNYRGLKRKGYIDRNATTQDALNECFYFTPFRNGSGAITPLGVELKRKQYLSWCDAIHELKKKKKNRGK